MFLIFRNRKMFLYICSVFQFFSSNIICIRNAEVSVLQLSLHGIWYLQSKLFPQFCVQVWELLAVVHAVVARSFETKFCVCITLVVFNFKFLFLLQCSMCVYIHSILLSLYENKNKSKKKKKRYVLVGRLIIENT